MKKKYNKNIYTDIALEVAENIGEVDGVTVAYNNFEDAELKTTIVDITDENGSTKMGKPKGRYITLESPLLKYNDPPAHERIISELAKNLAYLYEFEAHDTILVVGLGNWNVTPDALGPRVVNRLLVTRHIRNTDAVPEEIDESVRSVCALTPGVMGITGIETFEIVKGVVDRVKPDVVIAIDALAARSVNRINCTIQMSNTGVNPGAGLGNKRKPLNFETMGVPVIAIGVPTVVDAATLINDSLDGILDNIIAETNLSYGDGESSPDKDFYEMLLQLSENDRYDAITKSLEPYAGNMFVTPKEVDAVIDRLSAIIGNGINISLHPGITIEDINKFA